MIENFRHKGLKKFFETRNTSGINKEHASKLLYILLALDSCTNVNQLRLPGLKLHKLTGRLKDFYAVWVSGNWRIIFKFNGQDVIDVDYLDYH
jgi:proteic killer suppression protein